MDSQIQISKVPERIGALQRQCCSCYPCAFVDEFDTSQKTVAHLTLKIAMLVESPNKNDFISLMHALQGDAVGSCARYLHHE